MIMFGSVQRTEIEKEKRIHQTYPTTLIYFQLLMRKLLIIESMVIGIIMLLLSIPIASAMSGKLLYEPKMLMGSFLMGGVIHILFEVLGLNESWCRTTYQ